MMMLCSWNIEPSIMLCTSTAQQTCWHSQHKYKIKIFSFHFYRTELLQVKGYMRSGLGRHNGSDLQPKWLSELILGILHDVVQITFIIHEQSMKLSS